MKLFLSNGTMQHRILQYRCPHQNEIRQVMIPAGRQVEVRDERYTPEQVKSLETQLTMAGAVLKTDAKHIGRPFSLLYWFDAPITHDAIDESRARDIKARQDVSAEVTEAAGLATFATLAMPNPDKVQETSLEVVQLDDHGGEMRRDVNYEATVSRRGGKRREGRKTEA